MMNNIQGLMPIRPKQNVDFVTGKIFSFVAN